MKNIFVEALRNVMTAYNDLLKLTNQKIEENNSRFSAEYAEKYNLELKEKKNQDYQDAVSMLNDIVVKIRELLAKANYPDSADFTSDTKFFEGVCILTDKEIEALGRKYADDGNFTMVRYIQNWTERNNRVEIKFSMPLDQMKSYLKLAESARFTIDGIHSEQKAHFIDLEIESFADPIMCKNELDTVGSGECLKKFENKEVPDMILHSFDNVAL